MELSKREIGAILRLVEDRHVFRTSEKFNLLYELWQKLRAEYDRLEWEEEMQE